MKKNAIIILTVILLVVMLAPMASAASCRVAFSDPTATVGDKFNVKMSIGEQIAAVDCYIQYDASKMAYVSASGGVGNLNVSDSGGVLHVFDYYSTGAGAFSCSLTFKATATGTGSLTVSKLDVSDGNGDGMDASAGSSSVTVSEPYHASGDNNLTALSVSPGSLSPAFSASTQKYTMSVANSVKSISVDAKASDSKASVSVSGNKDLQLGKNTVTVSCKAENGDVRKYTIIVTRLNEEGKEPSQKEIAADSGKLLVEIGSTIFYVEKPADDSIPKGFTAAEDKELAATVYQKEQALPLIFGAEEGVENAFYYLDKTQKKLYLYHTLEIGQKSFAILCMEEGYLPAEGYEAAETEIGGKTVKVYKETTSSTAEYYLLPLLDSDGNVAVYIYDPADGTFMNFALLNNESPALLEKVERLESSQEELSAKVDEKEAQIAALTEEKTALEEQNKKQTEEKEKVEKALTGQKVMTFIAIGVAAVCAITCVALFVVGKNKKNK